jgi:hypothetical protein
MNDILIVLSCANDDRLITQLDAIFGNRNVQAVLAQDTQGTWLLQLGRLLMAKKRDVSDDEDSGGDPGYVFDGDNVDPSTREVLQLWLHLGRLRRAMKTVADPIIASKLLDHCVECEATSRLQVRLARSLPQVMAEYERDHLYDPFDQKEFMDFFMENQTYITLCSKCIHAAAVGKLNATDLQMLRMWLLQSRLRLDPPSPGRMAQISPSQQPSDHGPSSPEQRAAAAAAIAAALAAAEAQSSSSDDSFSDDSPDESITNLGDVEGGTRDGSSPPTANGNNGNNNTLVASSSGSNSRAPSRSRSGQGGHTVDDQTTLLITAWLHEARSRMVPGHDGSPVPRPRLAASSTPASVKAQAASIHRQQQQ